MTPKKSRVVLLSATDVHLQSLYIDGVLATEDCELDIHAVLCALQQCGVIDFEVAEWAARKRTSAPAHIENL